MTVEEKAALQKALGDDGDAMLSVLVVEALVGISDALARQATAAEALVDLTAARATEQKGAVSRASQGAVGFQLHPARS